MISINAKARVKIHQERPRLLSGNQVAYFQVGEDEVVENILTDAGRVSLHTFIYATAAQRTAASLGAGMHFIGLSDDATAPADGDTSLTGEFVADGLSRAEGTVILPIGVGVLTSVSYQFTYTGALDQTIQKSALFDALAGGNMAHEILFTQRTLALNDTVTMTFEITLT